MSDTVQDQLIGDALEDGLNLLRIEAGWRKEVLSMLQENKENLIKELSKTDLTTKKKSELQKFLALREKEIDSLYKQIEKIGEDKLESVATVTSANVAKGLDNSLKVKVGKKLTEKQLTALAKGPMIEGSPMQTWWRELSARDKRNFRGAIQQGIILGEDMDSITRRVRGTKANDYKDGALDVNKHHARSLTRTAVQSMANQSRIETLAENPDTVKGLRWVSVLDEKTTNICMSLSKLAWRLPDLKPIGHSKKFPGSIAHWSCRSTQIAITYTWEELAGKKIKVDSQSETYQAAFRKALAKQGFEPEEIKSIEANQRASMDGPVSDLDWEQWLQNKGDAFALEKLGPSRFALWKSGKMTLRQLTDQDARPLTVTQLLDGVKNGSVQETEGTEFNPPLVAIKGPSDEQLEKAEKTLKSFKATKKGQVLKNKYANKVDQELPNADSLEKLAWVEDQAQQAQAAASKSATLSKAKKKLLNGQPMTKGQEELYLGLTDEEKAAFGEALEDAKKAKSADLAAKVKADLGEGLEVPKKHAEDFANLQKQSPQLAEEIEKQIEANKKAAVQKEAFEEAEKAAEKILDDMAGGHPVQAQALKESKGDTMQEKLSGALTLADSKAKGSLKEIVDSGTKLKKKTLAQELGLNDPEKLKKAIEGSEKPVGLLVKVETISAEKQAAASKASTLSGAKKKLLAGKAPTPAQQKVLASLEPEEMANFQTNLAEAQAAAAKKTKLANTPEVKAKADIDIQNQQIEIPDPSVLVKLKDLPGSTRPYLAQDPETGKKWVVKDSARGGGGISHFESEGLADSIYRAAGARAPASIVVKSKSKAIKIAEFIEGGETYAAWQGGKSKSESDSMRRQIQENFVLDALLANWDVAGLTNDNILIADNKAIRIDNGGALFFRAQGGKKSLPPEVAELSSLRDPKVNPTTAKIFADITQDQIDDQISQIVARKSSILAAAGQNQAVQKALEKRIDWLEAQLPAKGKKIKVTGSGSSASQIPQDIEERLSNFANLQRTAAVEIPADGPVFEDQILNVWKESNLSGENFTMIQGDLTFEGDEMIKKALRNAGINVEPTRGPAGGALSKAHPADNFWNSIEAAAKTVSVHAQDGGYNVATLNKFEQTKSNLASLKASNSDKEVSEMIKNYESAIEAIEEAKASKTALKAGQLKQFERRQKKADPNQSEIEGWQVSRKTSVAYYNKVSQGGRLVETSEINREHPHEYVWELKKGGVTATITGFDDSRGHGARTTQGVVTVKVQGDDSRAGTESAFQLLKTLKIEPAEPSLAEKEILYLHKVAALRNDHKRKDYLEVYESSQPTEQKLEKLKKWAEKNYNVKLPRDPKDFHRYYNPEGELPTSGVGKRFWMRWDYDEKDVNRITKNKVLFHGSGNPVAAFLGWVDNGGQATTTAERLRTGVSLTATGGASADADISSGGANFLFANVTTRSKAENKGGFIFKGENIARIDIRSDQGDSYGRWEAAAGRRGKLEDIAAQTTLGITVNSGNLKGGINLFDQLESLKVTPGQRAEIIKGLRDRGFTKWPDGRKLEEIFR